MQKLLDIREKLELDQKNKLAVVAGEYQQALQKQELILEKSNDMRNQVFQKMDSQLLSINELRHIDQLNTHVSQYARSLLPEIEQKKQAMEKEREKYAQVHRDKKVLENLKKKELQKFKQEQIKAENRIMDEIAKNFSHDLSTYYEGEIISESIDNS